MENVVLFDEIRRRGSTAIPGDGDALQNELDELEEDLIRRFITGVKTGEIKSLWEIVSYLDGLQDLGIRL